VFGATYAALLRFREPIMLSEAGTSTVGGNASKWIRASLLALPSRYPRVKAVIWSTPHTRRASTFQVRGQTADAFRQSISRSALLREPLRLRALLNGNG
jgi:hypothetical protein